MPSINEVRQRIMLSKSNKKIDHSLDICLNKVWYNLLASDDSNFDRLWKNNLSNDCVTKVKNYKELWK